MCFHKNSDYSHLLDAAMNSDFALHFMLRYKPGAGCQNSMEGPFMCII